VCRARCVTRDERAAVVGARRRTAGVRAARSVGPVAGTKAAAPHTSAAVRITARILLSLSPLLR